MTAAAGLPPGPSLPPAVQTLWYGFDPYGFFGANHRRYGDAFTVRIMRDTWVMLADPEDVRDVFAHGPEELNSGEANLALRPIIGTRNVLLLDGNEHLARRRMVLPPFHGERMRTYAELIAAATEREMASWPLDRPLELLPRMQAITFEVILRAVFGLESAAEVERLRALLSAFMGWTTNMRRSLVFALLGPDRLMAMRGFRRQLAPVDAAVYEVISRRRAAGDAAEREDVLSMLLLARDETGDGLSDEDLRDELVTLLVAGHETTATTLAWAAHELARAPGLQARLADGEHGYTDAVVSETLRLHPPLPLVVRRLRTPLRVAGHDLPAGATVAPCTVVLHRRADLYPDPQEFRPERFIDGRPPAGAFLPFGGGVRRCIGAAFASFEARIVLEQLAARFVMSPDHPRRERVARRGVLIVPGRGARVRLWARSSLDR